jgi:hypothetical protein
MKTATRACVARVRGTWVAIVAILGYELAAQYRITSGVVAETRCSTSGVGDNTSPLSLVLASAVTLSTLIRDTTVERAGSRAPRNRAVDPTRCRDANVLGARSSSWESAVDSVRLTTDIRVASPGGALVTCWARGIGRDDGIIDTRANDAFVALELWGLHA